LCANAAATLPELSFFERAELPEATLLNAQQLGEKMMQIYPSTPVRHNVEGTVVLNVIVTPDGRATDCQIKRTSGNGIIDRWACVGTERYARFTPASNADKQPILSQWTESFTLKLGDPDTSPKGAPPNAPPGTG
jgi:TonB family protein